MASHGTYSSVRVDVGHDIMLPALLLHGGDTKVVVGDSEKLGGRDSVAVSYRLRGTHTIPRKGPISPVQGHVTYLLHLGDGGIGDGVDAQFLLRLGKLWAAPALEPRARARKRDRETERSEAKPQSKGAAGWAETYHQPQLTPGGMAAALTEQLLHLIA